MGGGRGGALVYTTTTTTPLRNNVREQATLMCKRPNVTSGSASCLVNNVPASYDTRTAWLWEGTAHKGKRGSASVP